MPQMAPYDWLTMEILMIMIIIWAITYIFFILGNHPKLKKYYKKIKKIAKRYWKW